VLTWAAEVRRMYDDAQAWRSAHPTASGTERAAIYQVLVNRTVVLGKQYAQVHDHPCNALAKRLLRHQDELFQFVVRDGVSANNNLAERTIRPLVVIRKISGGTRSDDGTKTRLGLASLFGTWDVRGLNPFVECFRLLRIYPKTAISHRMLAQANWMKASQLLAFLHQRVRMLRRLTSQAKVRSTTQRLAGNWVSPGTAQGSGSVSFLRRLCFMCTMYLACSTSWCTSS
jgi:hypothetical protein